MAQVTVVSPEARCSRRRDSEPASSRWDPSPAGGADDSASPHSRCRCSSRRPSPSRSWSLNLPPWPSPRSQKPILVPRQIERRVEHLPTHDHPPAPLRVLVAVGQRSGRLLGHPPPPNGVPGVTPTWVHPALAGAYHERVEVIRIFQIGREGVEVFQKARLRGVVGAAGPGPGPAPPADRRRPGRAPL